MTHVWIAYGQMRWLALAPTDVIAVPPEQSVICAADWAEMCRLAGGEAELMAALGVVYAES